MSEPNVATLAGYVLGVNAPPGTYASPGSFYELLVRTTFQADRPNRARLGYGFPLVVAMVTAYKDDPGGVARLERAAETGEWHG